MMSRATALFIARISALVIAILVAFLFADYVVARTRKPKDDARLVEMQVKVRTNASLARDLAADQKEITEARAARKARLRWLSFLLIAAGATFIGSAKWYLELTPAQPAPKPDRGADSTVVPVRELQTTAVPAALDLTYVDQIIAQQGATKEAAIRVLQAIQAHYRYLPTEALERVCQLTG